MKKILGTIALAGALTFATAPLIATADPLPPCSTAETGFPCTPNPPCTTAPTGEPCTPPDPCIDAATLQRTADARLALIQRQRAEIRHLRARLARR